MDPAEPSPEPFKIRSLDVLLDVLREVNERAICPICTANRGWIRPHGTETITLSLSGGGTISAIPMVCDHCGYMRLHAAKSERDDP